jgi:hypothetical protein
MGSTTSSSPSGTTPGPSPAPRRVGAAATLVAEAYLGRYVPDRTALRDVFCCPLPGGGRLITLPFVHYGEERARRLKPGYFVDPDGAVRRELLEGLGPEAVVLGRDLRHRYTAWTDATRTCLRALDDRGAVAWEHRLRTPGCARTDPGGAAIVGSPGQELRRLDPNGVVLTVDPDNTHSVWRLDSIGTASLRIGTADSALNRSRRGVLCYPMDVVALADDTLVVAELGRSQHARFDASGAPIGTVNAAQLGVDELCCERLFVDLDRGRVLAAARRNREVWLVEYVP